MLGEAVEDVAATRGSPPATAARTAATRAAHRRPRARRRDEARGRVVRALPGRGARRRRARGPGPGRAVRHPRRLDARRRRRAPGRRRAGLVPPSRRRDPRGPRVRPRRPRRGAAHAALGRARTSRCRSRPSFGAGARSDRARSGRKVDGAIERSRSTPGPQGEVRRLSGGNQQKVTIARWVAGGVRTMLCFDPTRGIDIRTKHQIYVLLRDLAEAGAAVLLYTSELKEIQLACDRAIVIFGGRVVAEIAVADADEPTLLRAAYNLKSDARDARGARRRGRRDGRRRGAPSATGRSEPPRADRERADDRATAARGRRPASLARAPAQRAGRSGCSGSSSLLLVFTKLIQPTTASPASRASRSPCCRSPSRPSPRRSSSSPAGSTSRSAAMMALDAACVSAVADEGPVARSSASSSSSACSCSASLLGAINGGADRGHPGARTSSSRSRCRSSGRAARCSCSTRPGGGSATWLKELVLGLARQRVDPEGARSCWSSSSPSIWIPLRRSRLGLSIYAIGSNRLAAFRSGVAGRPDEDRRLRAHRACSRRSAACRSPPAPASATPVPGPYTLLSVAAVVLGGVSLAGGRGGVFGPIVAVVILQLDPDRHDLPQRQHEPRGRRPGRDPDRRGHDRQPRPDPAGRAHERRRRRHRTPQPAG